MGTRPRYWLIRTKVGLVARVVAPSPRTTPWMKQVFPAPSSPTRATTSPGPSAAASRSPAASVCSALVVRSSVVIATEPLERLGERRDDIAGDQRLFADALGGDVAREPVQVDGGLEGGAGRHAARQEGAEDPCEDIAGPAARHPRISGRVHEDAPLGIADRAPGPLEDDVDTMARGELTDRLEPVTLDVGHGASEQARHLPGVRREAARRRRGAERVQVTGEHAEAVGVDRHRLRDLGGERARRRSRLLVEPDPRPERDSIAHRRELGDDLARLERERARAGLGQGLGHRFYDEAGDDGLLAGWRRHGHEADARPQRGRRRERRRAALAERARDDEQVSVASLVGVARARRKVGLDIVRLQQERRHPAQDFFGRNPDRHDLDVPGQRGAGPRDEAALDPGERQREERADRRPCRRVAIGGDPRRDVERDNRPAARVDQLDEARDAPFGGATRARAEKRVDDHVRAREGLLGGFEVLDEPRPYAASLQLAELLPRVAADLILGEREQDLHPRPPFPQPARDDEAVAAVAALAADDDHTRAAAPRLEVFEQRPDRLGGAAAGVLHERGAGDAELGDGALVETSHLLRREDPLHGGYRPGSAAAAWRRKSARTAV